MAMITEFIVLKARRKVILESPETATKGILNFAMHLAGEHGNFEQINLFHAPESAKLLFGTVGPYCESFPQIISFDCRFRISLFCAAMLF